VLLLLLLLLLLLQLASVPSVIIFSGAHAARGDDALPLLDELSSCR